MIANILLRIQICPPMLLSRRTVFLWFPILSRLIFWQKVQEKEKNHSKIEKKKLGPSPEDPRQEARKIGPEARALKITNTQNFYIIQKLYTQSITFEFIYTIMASQSRDQMISIHKNRRTAAHLSCRLKEIFLNNSY